MKVILLASLIALTLSQTHALPECNADNSLLPNPSDCKSYFICLNGKPILMPCPPGLEWSKELTRCDFPNVAKCSETETKPPINPTESTPAWPSTARPDHCPEVDGPKDVLLPNPADCGSFYKCLNGIPHLIPCPPGQEWSIELNRCDYPEIAKCKETVTKPDEPPTSDKKCPAEDGPEDVLLPNPADCGSFFKCLGGQPILNYCPPGLEWSVAFNRCEYPEIAKCVETEEKPTPAATTSAPVTSKPQPEERPDHCPAEDGPEDVLLPNPADCGSFFKCLGGQPHLISCPSGLHWSIELNRCDYPVIAKCEKKQLKHFRNDSECPLHNEGYDILFPNPEDCSTYFQCDNGVKVLKKCPVGTLWDSIMTRCDHAGIAHCAE